MISDGCEEKYSGAFIDESGEYFVTYDSSFTVAGIEANVHKTPLKQCGLRLMTEKERREGESHANQ